MSEEITQDELEREKTESYELGRISALNSIASDLRDEAGEIYGHDDSNRSYKKAKLLKEKAQDLEDRAEEERKRWEEKYKEEEE